MQATTALYAHTSAADTFKVTEYAKASVIETPHHHLGVEGHLTISPPAQEYAVTFKIKYVTKWED